MPEAFIAVEIAIIAGLFLILVRDFTYNIYIWLFTLLFFKYQNKISMMGSVLPDISFDRILLASVIFIFIFQALAKKRKMPGLTKTEYTMILFCIMAVVSMVWTGAILKANGKLNLSELLGGYLVPFTMFYMSQSVYDNKQRREGLLKFIILTGIYLGFTAIFEHIGMNKLIFPKYILDADIGIHFGRARGPFVQAAVNGTVLGFVFMAIFYFIFKYKGPRIWRLCSITLLGIIPLAIFFTYTRACWLGAALGFLAIAIFIFKQRQKAFAVTAILFFLTAMLIAPSFLDDNSMAFAHERLHQEDPVYARISLYIIYLNMFINNPVFGVGFMKFTDNSSDYFIDPDSEYIPVRYTEGGRHDSFASILAEMGLVGTGLLLLIYFSIFSASVRLYKRLSAQDSADKNFVVVFWGIAIVYIVNSIFIEMRYVEFVNSLFFMYAGVIYGWERQYAKGILA
ncbi:MAG: O-antigen ligase family protein [Candidatus Omnitrophota bacterium]|nr:O-antigen ligase family protein [Candidatus Omnitrophota bacterium]